MANSINIANHPLSSKRASTFSAAQHIASNVLNIRHLSCQGYFVDGEQFAIIRARPGGESLLCLTVRQGTSIPLVFND